MEGINKKYNLEIEVLTPLCIGAGAEKNWARGVDFVVKNGSLYKLNLKKMIANGIEIDELTTYFAQRDESAILSKLGDRLEAVSDVPIPYPAESDYDVKTFVKNQFTGKPVLTGSSLKGAIRSVLFQHFGGKTKDGKEVFGSSIVGDEFMRFIKISDVEFDETTLVNTKIFNLKKRQDEWLGGWKYDTITTRKEFSSTGFNTIYESLMPHQTGYASLMLSETTYKKYNLDFFYQRKIEFLQSQLQKERRDAKRGELEKKLRGFEKLKNTIERKNGVLLHDGLFSIINQHTLAYLTKERAFFERYATDKTSDIINSINAIIEQIPCDNSYCILKMSAGSGFHSITGDWQFDDYSIDDVRQGKVSRGLLDGKASAKSRKIAVWDDQLALMGFVKLRAVTQAVFNINGKQ